MSVQAHQVVEVDLIDCLILCSSEVEGVGLFNCPGWSQSGGPWVKPEEAMRNWTSKGIEICKTKQGADVTCGPCSNEAEGLEVDKLSKHHVQKHFESFIGEILRRIPPKDRKTLTTVVVEQLEEGIPLHYSRNINVRWDIMFCDKGCVTLQNVARSLYIVVVSACHPLT